jgi:hypothetical protein
MYLKIACSAFAREGKSMSWMSSALMVLQKLSATALSQQSPLRPLEEAEALGELVGDQVAQADVVADADEAHVAHVAHGLCRRRADGNVTEHDADLAFEVAASGLVGEGDRRARREHVAAPALVDERDGLQGGRRLGLGRLYARG